MKTPVICAPRTKRTAIVLAGAAAALASWWGVSVQASPQTVNATVAEQVATEKAGAASQSRVNQLDESGDAAARAPGAAATRNLPQRRTRVLRARHHSLSASSARCRHSRRHAHESSTWRAVSAVRSRCRLD